MNVSVFQIWYSQSSAPPNDLEVNRPAVCFIGPNQSVKAGASYIFLPPSRMVPNPKQIMTGNVSRPALIGSSAVINI